jgi:precorrin-3B synthase
MPSAPEAKGCRPGAPEVKGWCPGAYAPMQSNDGLLMRAKIVGSRIASAQVEALAAIASACGNGLVDLSQRAQLQLRGVSEATLGDALQRLDAAGLLAPDADAERVTNIVASPLAGLGVGAFDANALATELAQGLQADASLRALPPKFLFAIDDGGPPPLDDVEADIRIEAAQRDRVAVSLAGGDDRAAVLDPAEAVPAALSLARAFVGLRDGAFELRRMRRLVARLGVDAVMNKAEIIAEAYVRPRQAAPVAFLGAVGTSVCYAGVAAPFGRWTAAELLRLAALAREHGSSELRLTPWRAFLIPTETREAAQRIVAEAGARGLIVSSDDPRLAVVACPGAPECPQAQGETRAHLARLAPLAQKLAGTDGVGLHLSGCAKGCARPKSAPVTLVASNGLFDLVENGGAGDAAHLKGLTIDAVESALAARTKEKLCPTP